MAIIYFDSPEDDYDLEDDEPNPEKPGRKSKRVEKKPKEIVTHTQADLIAGLNKLLNQYSRGYYYGPRNVPIVAIAPTYIKQFQVRVSYEFITELEVAYHATAKKKALLRAVQPVAKKYQQALDDVSLNLPHSLLLTLTENDPQFENKVIWAVASFFADVNLHRLFMNEQPIEVQHAAAVLMWAKKQTANELGTAVGTSLTQKSKNGNSIRLAPMFEILPSQEQQWARIINLYWPRTIRQAVREAYAKPDDYELHPVAELPPNLRLWTDGDLVIYDELQKLLAYTLMGNIALNASGKVSAAAYKKMRKQLGVKEFYTESDTPFGLIRTIVLAQLLASIPPKKIEQTKLDTLELLDVLRQASQTHFVVLFALNDLKNHGSVSLHSYKHQVEEEINTWMNRLPVGEWVSVENIVNYSAYRDLPSISQHLPGYYALAGSPDYNGLYVQETNVDRYVDKPALLAGLWLFAALGLLDVAYDLPTGKGGIAYFSSYDGLRYVRLNSLGAHLFDRSPEPYVPKVNTATQALQFDETSLLIFCDPDNKVAETVLANYAERVSPTRFRVTPGTFLKGCATKKQLQNKITLFSKSVAPKLPANWTAFFADLLAKAEPIKPLGNLAVFALTQTDPALIRLIAQDAVLKTLVIKAEGYRILVETDNVPKLKKRLGELGYLV